MEKCWIKKVRAISKPLTISKQSRWSHRSQSSNSHCLLMTTLWRRCSMTCWVLSRQRRSCMVQTMRARPTD